MQSLDRERRPLLNINESFASFIEQYDGIADEEVQAMQHDKVVVHKVSYDDTLEGISLQYGVSPIIIREYNGITSDSIYYLKEVKIPNPKDYYESHNAGTSKETLHGLKKLYLVNYILQGDDKNEKVASYYLDSNDWNMEAAVKEYQEDLRFDAAANRGNHPSNTKISKKKVKQE